MTELLTRNIVNGLDLDAVGEVVAAIAENPAAALVRFAVAAKRDAQRDTADEDVEESVHSISTTRGDGQCTTVLNPVGKFAGGLGGGGGGVGDVGQIRHSPRVNGASSIPAVLQFVLTDAAARGGYSLGLARGA